MKGISPTHKAFASKVAEHTRSRVVRTGDHQKRQERPQRTSRISHAVATPPDAQLAETTVGGDTYQVGDSVTYTLSISLSADGGDIVGQTPLTVTDVVPIGFSALTASGKYWNAALDNTTSPATMTAAYTGPTPILSGTTLPAIMLTGLVTDDAVGNVQNTATLNLDGDANSTNNTATVVIQVSRVLTPTPEPTSPPEVEPTATVTPVPSTELGISLVDDATVCTNTGDIVTYTATVANGTIASQIESGQPIAVTITLPDGVSDVTPDGGTDWLISMSGSTVLANYSGSYPIDPGASLTPIVITATMQTPGDIHPVSSATVTIAQDTNSSNNVAIDTLTLCAPDMVTYITHQDADVFQVGQPVLYTVSVSNNTESGPILAGQTIIVTDTVPSSVGQVIPTGTGWQFTTASSVSATTVTATYVGTYPVLTGESLSDITISGVLTRTAVPTVVNTATVSTPLDSDSSNNLSSDTLDVVAAPDLVMSLQHSGNACILVQHPVAWTLKVTNKANAGPVFNGPITVTDTLPMGVSGVQVSGDNWNITKSNTLVTATYTGDYPIDVGAELTPITIMGTIAAGAGPTLRSTAQASTPGDGNAANDTLSDTVAVCRVLPDMAVHITHNSVHCITTGNIVTYTVMASNVKGGQVETGEPIAVTIALPAGFGNIVPDGGTDWQTTVYGTTVVAYYSGSYPVTVGKTLLPITITAVLQTLKSSAMVSQATVKTSHDSNSANNTAQDVEILCPPRLMISKTHQGSGPFHVGQRVTYMITVSDKVGTGPVLAGQTIEVDDIIPSGLKSIKAFGTNWQLTVGTKAVIAIYKGHYPVVEGQRLPAIMITGILATPSFPTMINTATVKTSSGSNKVANTVSNTLIVRRK